MDVLHKSEDKFSSRKIPRRTALRAALEVSKYILATSIAGNLPGNPLLVESRDPVEAKTTLDKLKAFGVHESNTTLYKYLESNSDDLVRIEQILSYREKIGMASFPQEIATYDPMKAQDHWNNNSPHFVNELPSSANKVGEAARSLMTTIYGQNGLKVVNKISIWNGTAFNTAERAVLFPLLYAPGKSDILRILAHEEAHGIDPGHFANYPPEMFFKLEVAKWQMLSQAFAKEGQLMELYNGLIPKQINAFIGKTAAFEYLNNPDFNNIHGAAEIKTAIADTAFSLGIPVENIIFTKRFVYNLGKNIHKRMTMGRQFFFQNVYENSVDEGLKELYAELISYGILPISILPLDDTSRRESAEMVQNNPQVVTGIAMTASIMRGENVTIGKLRNEVAETYWGWDSQLVEAAPIIMTTVSSSTDTSQALPTTDSIYQKADSLMRDFLTNGVMPESALARLDTNTHTLMINYLEAYQTVIKHYPRAGEEHRDPETAIVAFDPPNLSIWESEKITQALRSSILGEMMVELLTSADMTKYYDYLLINSEVLLKFVSDENW